VNRQILSRLGEYCPVAASKGVFGDRIGLLKNQIAEDPQSALASVLDTGLLSLLYELLGLPPEQPLLYADLVPGTITILDRGHVEHAPGLTPQLRSCLRELASGRGTKAELVRSVWGYDYHPLRHDPVVYSALASLRKLLGARASWIETTEDGYRLTTGVRAKFQSVGTSAEAGDESLVEAPSSRQESATLLNHRQIALVRALKPSDFVTIKTYRKRFGVSDMTALRDLAALQSQGFVVRVGRARATRYAHPKTVLLSDGAQSEFRSGDNEGETV
jgi:DNA-binding winged helix-turn-helix (wHTH) protein